MATAPVAKPSKGAGKSNPSATRRLTALGSLARKKDPGPQGAGSFLFGKSLDLTIGIDAVAYFFRGEKRHFWATRAPNEAEGGVSGSIIGDEPVGKWRVISHGADTPPSPRSSKWDNDSSFRVSAGRQPGAVAPIPAPG